MQLKCSKDIDALHTESAQPVKEHNNLREIFTIVQYSRIIAYSTRRVYAIKQ